MKNKYLTGFCFVLFCISASAWRQDDRGKSYRHVGKDAYEILDTADFYLYYRYAEKEVVKGKGLVTEGDYYFSRDRNSKIVLLTIKNIQEVFSENARFRYALDAHFRNDRELMDYDRWLHTYKIKYVYRLSLK